MLSYEEYLNICRKAYMYKMFAGENRKLQFKLLKIKLSKTKRQLIISKFELADYMLELLIAYRNFSYKKKLLSSPFRRKKFVKEARAFIKELRTY